MNTMKALYNVSFPKIKDQTEAERHFNTTNNERLNANFAAIADSIYEVEAILDAVSDTIVAEGISGSWYYIRFDSGIVMAWLITEVISEVISTALNALYSSEQSYDIPSGLFSSIEDVSVMVKCATPVWATVKAIDVDALDIYFVTTASASYDVQTYARIIGRA